MKEQLNGKLVEILTSIQTATGKVSDFALEQLPDIAQSYIAYGRVYGTTMLVVSVALFVLCFLGSRSTLKKTEDDDATEPEIIGMFINGFCAIYAAIYAISSVGSVFLVWFAPKVWLLKELASMVK